MDSPSLSHDGSTSRGKDILSIGLRGSSDQINLGARETVGKDGLTIAEEISSHLSNLQDLGKEFPETSPLVDSLDISSFDSVMGDHTPSNGTAVSELKKLTKEGDLQQIGCHAHKCDLVEETFRKALAKECSSKKQEVIGSDEDSSNASSNPSLFIPLSFGILLRVAITLW